MYAYVWLSVCVWEGVMRHCTFSALQVEPLCNSLIFYVPMPDPTLLKRPRPRANTGAHTHPQAYMFTPDSTIGLINFVNVSLNYINHAVDFITIYCY